MLIEHNVMCKPQLSHRELNKVAAETGLNSPSDVEDDQM